MESFLFKSLSQDGNAYRTLGSLSSEDAVVSGITGKSRLGRPGWRWGSRRASILAHVVAGSTRGGHRVDSKNIQFAVGALLHPRFSAVEMQVLDAMYSKPAQAVSATAADLQVAETQGGDYSPHFLTGKWKLCFPGWRGLWSEVFSAGLIRSDVRQIVLLGCTVVI
jgi:hypothetical protein